MTKAQLELMREWVRAEIAEAIESDHGRECLFESIRSYETFKELSESLEKPNEQPTT